MDKLPVGQLPDLQQSNNDDEIMVITNSEYNQLKKEKISDLITDFTSTNENNALTKGTDGKMFVTDFGNASNITEGTLPVSVLPDIPKDKLPDIEITDLPASGVTADTYAYPSSVTVNAQGMVIAIEEGTPSGSNANVDLSNITEAGKEVIRENSGSASGLPVGYVGFTQGAVDETKNLVRELNGQTVIQNAITDGLFDWFEDSVALNPDMATTLENWQTENEQYGMCGKFVYTAAVTTNYYAYSSGSTTYFTTSTDDSETVNVYNAEFELQGTGSISSGVLTYNEQTYTRASGSDDTQTTPATLKLPNFPNYFIGAVSLEALPVVGNGISLGLTNNASSGSALYMPNGQGYIAINKSLGQPVGTSSSSAPWSSNMTVGVTTDPTKSGLTTVAPQDAYKIPGTYFIQIATGQETEVNITNEIELNNPFFFGMSQYFDVEPNNLSWLKSSGQWNSKAVYPDYYNWLLQEKNNPSTLPASEANVDIAGSLINNNGVLSGFSESNYAQINQVPSSVTSFEIVMKVTTGASVTTNRDQIILGQLNNYTSPQMAVDANGTSHFNFSAAISSSEWGEGLNSLEAAQPNTTYWLRGTWDGTTISFYLKTSEEAAWELQESASQTAVEWSQLMVIGNDYDTGGMVKFFQGTIDLNGCYININGSRWWSGMTNGVKFSTEDYSDYDFVINTSDETFRLPLKNGTEGQFAGGAVVGNGQGLGVDISTGQTGYMGYGQASNFGGYNQMFDSPALGSLNNSVFNGNVGVIGVTTDPAKSGLVVVGTGEVPDGWSLYYYVGETVQNANLIDAGRIVENFATKQYATSASFPSDRYIDLTLGESGSVYTAPADGWVSYWADGFVPSGYIGLDVFKPGADTTTWRNAKYCLQIGNAQQSGGLAATIPVVKGDRFLLGFTSTINYRFKFIYAQGAQ